MPRYYVLDVSGPGEAPSVQIQRQARPRVGHHPGGTEQDQEVRRPCLGGHQELVCTCLPQHPDPNVVACLETEDPNRDWKFLKDIDHETVNLLTHMHFLHLSGGLGNFRQFEKFKEAVCQVERKGLFNKLQALASGNKYALHDIYRPGFQIYLAGSVAYVAQCIPVEARLYDPVNCTQQIPAEIGSEEHRNVTQRYANAQTMIL
jgi:hypothetical protein